MRAKKNLKNHPTKELKKGFWFNTDFYTKGWSDNDILKTYAIRPAIEAGQASNNTFYNSQRGNTRGKAMAIKNRALNYILDLLMAITATKLGRSDLIIKVGTFSSSREYMGKQVWVKMAREANFQIIALLGLNERQKAFWDRRKKWEQELKRRRKSKKI